jgi:hypothetical protein
MEINNIPKIAANTTTDSHHGVVRFSARVAVLAFDGVRRRRVAVLRLRVPIVSALSQ